MKKFTETNIGILLLSIIPSIITYKTMINNITMNINISHHIPFISAIGVFLLMITILYIRRWVLIKLRQLDINNLQIKSILVKQKYYDIMLIKFDERYVGHTCTVKDYDLELFSTYSVNSGLE